jgi:hypothetical protein
MHHGADRRRFQSRGSAGRRGAKLAALALLLAGTPLAHAAAPPELRCPATVSVRAEPMPPAGWNAEAITSDHGFATISVAQAAAGPLKAGAATPIPADHEQRRGRALTQVWDLRAHRKDKETLVLTCRYAGTTATLTVELARELRRCEQMQTLDVRHNVVDDPHSPPAMVCR